MTFTSEQIKQFKAAGRDYAGDWLSWGNDPDKFEGQSEALDSSRAYDDLTPLQQECAADYIYDGMVAEIRRACPGSGKPVGSSTRCSKCGVFLKITKGIAPAHLPGSKEW